MRIKARYHNSHFSRFNNSPVLHFLCELLLPFPVLLLLQLTCSVELRTVVKALLHEFDFSKTLQNTELLLSSNGSLVHKLYKSAIRLFFFPCSVNISRGFETPLSQRKCGLTSKPIYYLKFFSYMGRQSRQPLHTYTFSEFESYLTLKILLHT